ncbi:2-dehydropantoate 2-reductase [Chitinivorax sp. B]|uniref:ketopantoate reductase family protein n=1 Tax=Chitinivorax sp. B TaxID=2502235 RepID=UPI0010F6901C|nr:2-dehydropantoate 2-reductase [Chitinivorax sp. B]
MRFAMMGSGGVGGYFGARLAAAGHDVHFIARGTHLQAMQQQGLHIHSNVGDLHLPHPQVTADPASIGAVDVVFFAVKLWDTETAAQACKPLIGPETVLIPLQNGVESITRISQHLPQQQVVGGVAYISANISQPGVIAHVGDFAKLRFGEPSGQVSARLQAIETACREAGVDGQQVPNIQRALWEKYIFLVTLSGWTSVTRTPIGLSRHDPDIRPQLIATLQEVAALARAQGVELADDVVDKQLSIIDSLPREMKSSMLHDLEHGRQLEAPWLAGGVARMSAAAGLAAPVSSTLYAALKPWANGGLTAALAVNS